MVGMTDKEIEEAEQIARRYGPANCWTGTSGMMAEWILKLVRELKRRRDAERLEVSSEEVQGLYPRQRAVGKESRI